MQRIKLITKDIKLNMKMIMNTGIDFCWESSLHFYRTNGIKFPMPQSFGIGKEKILGSTLGPPSHAWQSFNREGGGRR